MAAAIQVQINAHSIWMQSIGHFIHICHGIFYLLMFIIWLFWSWNSNIKSVNGNHINIQRMRMWYQIYINSISEKKSFFIRNLLLLYEITLNLYANACLWLSMLELRPAVMAYVVRHTRHRQSPSSARIGNYGEKNAYWKKMLNIRCEANREDSEQKKIWVRHRYII